MRDSSEHVQDGSLQTAKDFGSSHGPVNNVVRGSGEKGARALQAAALSDNATFQV